MITRSQAVAAVCIIGLVVMLAVIFMPVDATLRCLGQ